MIHAREKLYIYLKLELIFIDMYTAKHEFSNKEYIQCEHIIKSNNPMEVVMSLNESN